MHHVVSDAYHSTYVRWLQYDARRICDTVRFGDLAAGRHSLVQAGSCPLESSCWSGDEK